MYVCCDGRPFYSEIISNFLIFQIEDQLKRLLTQLQDIEEMKQDMDEEEYESTRKVMTQQLS